MPHEFRPDAGWGAALLLAGMLASAALFTAPGTFDVTDPRVGFLAWMDDAVEHGPVDGYRVDPYDYPPGAKALLGAAGSLGDRLGLERAASFKLLLLLFQAATALAAFALTRRLLLAGALWLSTVVSAMAHGYLDILFAPFLVISLVGVATRRAVPAWVFLWLACFIKHQPFILVPFYIVHLGGIDGVGGLWRFLRQPNTWGVAAWTGAAVLLVVIAFGRTETGQWAAVQALQKATAHRDISGNALNAPWIGSYVYQVSKYGELGPARVREARRLLPIKAAAVSVLLWVLWLQMRLPKTPRAGLVAMLAGYLAYFTFNAGVHENHLFVPMLLALVIVTLGSSLDGAGARGTLVPLAIGVVAFAHLNLLLFYDWQGLVREPVLIGTRQLDASVPLAGISLVLFAAAVAALRGSDQRAGERASSRAAAKPGRERSTISSLAVNEIRK
jgi:hypothetical protein